MLSEENILHTVNISDKPFIRMGFIGACLMLNIDVKSEFCGISAVNHFWHG